jgi:hypothetical protein
MPRFRSTLSPAAVLQRPRCCGRLLVQATHSACVLSAEEWNCSWAFLPTYLEDLFSGRMCTCDWCIPSKNHRSLTSPIIMHGRRRHVDRIKPRADNALGQIRQIHSSIDTIYLCNTGNPSLEESSLDGMTPQAHGSHAKYSESTIGIRCCMRRSSKAPTVAASHELYRRIEDFQPCFHVI